MAGVLRGLGEVPPSDMACVEDARPEPPVPLCAPWIDPAGICASCAKDVIERVSDDRSRAERRELYDRTLGAARLARAPKFNFSTKVKAKVMRPRAERTAEERERHREYMRTYMRESRACQKARDALVNSQPAPT